jgi:hypothetical protein
VISDLSASDSDDVVIDDDDGFPASDTTANENPPVRPADFIVMF